MKENIWVKTFRTKKGGAYMGGAMETHKRQEDKKTISII